MRLRLELLYGARVAEIEPAADDALLAASVAGDARAFRTLVDRHAGQAYAVALRLTGSRADAEDVVQEAFLRVWRRASLWRSGGAGFPSWLYTVVVNLCRDAARAGKHRRHAPLDEAQEVADPGPDALAALGRADEHRQLLAAVGELPERQRVAVALTYAGGLSNAEAAEALGISVGAVESLLVRARRELRARLRASERSGDDGE